MSDFRLTPRQKAITELLGKNETVADIGCDHGILSVYLAENGYARHVFATDISAASLQKARNLAQKRKIELEFFVCDGFSGLPVIPSAAVISGIGGDGIARIIAHPRAKTKLILQPMKDSAAVFQALQENGFCIDKEIIVRENDRFYEVLRALPGKMASFDFFLPRPGTLVMDTNAYAFFQHRLKVLQNAACAAGRSDGATARRRLYELNTQIQRIQEVLKDAPDF